MGLTIRTCALRPMASAPRVQKKSVLAIQMNNREQVVIEHIPQAAIAPPPDEPVFLHVYHAMHHPPWEAETEASTSFRYPGICIETLKEFLSGCTVRSQLKQYGNLPLANEEIPPSFNFRQTSMHAPTISASERVMRNRRTDEWLCKGFA